jgi:hypothetical protein
MNPNAEEIIRHIQVHYTRKQYVVNSTQGNTVILDLPAKDIQFDVTIMDILCTFDHCVQGVELSNTLSPHSSDRTSQLLITVDYNERPQSSSRLIIVFLILCAVLSVASFLYNPTILDTMFRTEL